MSDIPFINNPPLHRRGTKVTVKSFNGSLVATPVDGCARVSYTLPSGRKFWTVLPTELLEYLDE